MSVVVRVPDVKAYRFGKRRRERFDKIIYHIKINNRTLKHVRLRTANKDELKELFEALKSNTHVERVSLGWHFLCSAGVNRLCSLLLVNRTLRSIRIRLETDDIHVANHYVSRIAGSSRGLTDLEVEINREWVDFYRWRWTHDSPMPRYWRLEQQAFNSLYILSIRVGTIQGRLRNTKRAGTMFLQRSPTTRNAELRFKTRQAAIYQICLIKRFGLASEGHDNVWGRVPKDLMKIIGNLLKDTKCEDWPPLIK